jgi:hypothetical protein
MATYTSSGYEQATFETAVSSSASIVKPTVPKNVLAEFELFAATGTRFGKANPFDDEALATQPRAPQPEVRREAPPPPAQVIAPPQQSRPVDFSSFNDFSVNKPTGNQAGPSKLN